MSVVIDRIAFATQPLRLWIKSANASLNYRTSRHLEPPIVIQYPTGGVAPIPFALKYDLGWSVVLKCGECNHPTGRLVYDIARPAATNGDRVSTWLEFDGLAEIEQEAPHD